MTEFEAACWLNIGYGIAVAVGVLIFFAVSLLLDWKLKRSVIRRVKEICGAILLLALVGCVGYDRVEYHHFHDAPRGTQTVEPPRIGSDRPAPMAIEDKPRIVPGTIRVLDRDGKEVPAQNPGPALAPERNS